jgi:hypothetical protein
MSQVIVLCLVPLVPLTCLALLLWLDRLEETLDRDVDRRRRQAGARQAQLEASLAGASVSSVASASLTVGPGGPEVSLGGSTNR